MAKIATDITRTQSASQSRRGETASRQNSGDIQEQIAQLAYQFYVERGYQHGCDQEDWYRAESIVKGRQSTS